MEDLISQVALIDQQAGAPDAQQPVDGNVFDGNSIPTSSPSADAALRDAFAKDQESPGYSVTNNDLWQQVGMAKSPDKGFIGEAKDAFKTFYMERKAGLAGTVAELTGSESAANMEIGARADLLNRQDLQDTRGSMELLRDGPSGWGRLVGSGAGMFTFDIAPAIVANIFVPGSTIPVMMAGMWASTYGNNVDEMRAMSGDLLSDESIQAAAAQRSLLYAAIFGGGMGSQAAAAFSKTVLGRVISKSLADGTPVIDTLSWKAFNAVSRGIEGGGLRRATEGFLAGAAEAEVLAVVQRYTDQLTINGFDPRQGMTEKNLRIAETVMEMAPLAGVFGLMHSAKALAKRNTIDVVSRVTGKTGDEIEKALSPEMRQAWIKNRESVLKSLADSAGKSEKAGGILTIDDARKAEGLMRNMALAAWGKQPGKFKLGPSEFYNDLSFRFKQLTPEQMSSIIRADEMPVGTAEEIDARAKAYESAARDAGLLDVIELVGDRTDLKDAELLVDRMRKSQMVTLDAIKERWNRELGGGKANNNNVFRPDAVDQWRKNMQRTPADEGAVAREPVPADQASESMFAADRLAVPPEEVVKTEPLAGAAKVESSVGKVTGEAEKPTTRIFKKRKGVEFIDRGRGVIEAKPETPLTPREILEAGMRGDQIQINEDGSMSVLINPDMKPIDTTLAGLLKKEETGALADIKGKETNERDVNAAKERNAKRQIEIDEAQAKQEEIQKNVIDPLRLSEKDDTVKGAYAQNTIVNGTQHTTLRTIWLFQYADAGTVMHEFMHHMVDNGYLPDDVARTLQGAFKGNREAAADSLLAYMRTKTLNGNQQTKTALDFLARTFAAFYKEYEWKLQEEVRVKYDELFKDSEASHGKTTPEEAARGRTAASKMNTEGPTPENDMQGDMTRLFYKSADRFSLPGKVDVEFLSDGNGLIQIRASSPKMNGAYALDTVGEIRDGKYYIRYTDPRTGIDGDVVFNSKQEVMDAVGSLLRGETQSLESQQLQWALQTGKQRNTKDDIAFHTETISLPKPSFAGTLPDETPALQRGRSDWDRASARFHLIVNKIAKETGVDEATVRSWISPEDGPGHVKTTDAQGYDHKTPVETIKHMINALKRHVGDAEWEKMGIDHVTLDVVSVRKAKTGEIREGLISFLDSLNDRLNVQDTGGNIIGRAAKKIVRAGRNIAAMSFDTNTIIDMIHGATNGPLDFIKAKIRLGNEDMEKLKTRFITNIVNKRLGIEEEARVGSDYYNKNGSVVHHMEDKVDIGGREFQWQEVLFIWRVTNGGKFLNKNADGSWGNSFVRELAQNQKLTEAQVRGAVDFVKGNKGLLMFDDIMDQVTKEIYPEFEAAWKANGHPEGLGKINGKYVPFIRDFRLFENTQLDDLADQIDPKPASSATPNSGARHGKARSQDAYRGITSMKAYDGFFSYIDHVSNYIAKASKTQEMIDVLNNNGVKQAFERKFGDTTLLDALISNVTAERSLTGRTTAYGPMERTALTIRRNAAYAMLGGNPFTIARQPASLFTSMSIMPIHLAPRLFGDWAVLAAKTIWNAGQHVPLRDTREMQWAMQMFPDLRNRIIGSEMEFTRRSAGDVKSEQLAGNIKNYTKDQLLHRATDGIRAADQTVVLSVLRVAYQHKYAEGKVAGLSNENAGLAAKNYAREIVNLTNDPTNFSEMSRMQRENEFTKMFIPFSGFNFKFWQLLNRQFALPMVYEWRKGDSGSMVRLMNAMKAPLTKENAQFAALGIVAPAIMMGMIFRKRSPDKDEVVKDVLAYSFSSLPIMGGFMSSRVTGFDNQFGQALWQSIGTDLYKGAASIYKDATGEDGHDWWKDAGRASVVIGTMTHTPAFWWKTAAKSIESLGSTEHADTASRLRHALSLEEAPVQ